MSLAEYACKSAEIAAWFPCLARLMIALIGWSSLLRCGRRGRREIDRREGGPRPKDMLSASGQHGVLRDRNQFIFKIITGRDKIFFKRHSQRALISETAFRGSCRVARQRLSYGPQPATKPRDSSPKRQRGNALHTNPRRERGSGLPRSPQRVGLIHVCRTDARIQSAVILFLELSRG